MEKNDGMRKMLIINGTRSHIVRTAALIRNAQDIEIKHTYIGTDDGIEKLCRELEIEQPFESTHIDQTQPDLAFPETIKACENIIQKTQPDNVCVIGESLTTYAASMAAHLTKKPIIKLSAGNRYHTSWIREEAYAILSDHMATLLCADDEYAMDNLEKEGIDTSKCELTGGLHIDTLLQYENLTKHSKILKKIEVKSRAYALLSFHRPANTLHFNRAREIFGSACEIHDILPVVSTVHPHTQNISAAFDLKWKSKYAPIALKRLPYIDHLHLLQNAALVLTDSASVQDEASALGIPCLTLANETNRMQSIMEGTNICVGTFREDIVQQTKKALRGQWKRRAINLPLHDGKAALRTLKAFSAPHKRAAFENTVLKSVTKIENNEARKPHEHSV